MSVEININKKNIVKRPVLPTSISSVPSGSLSKTSAPLLKYMKKGKNVNKDSSSLLRFNPNTEYDIFAPELLLKENVNIAKEEILKVLNTLKAIPTDFNPETKITTPENFKITLRKRAGLEGNIITIEKKEYEKLVSMFSEYYRVKPLHAESFFYPSNPETRKYVIDCARLMFADSKRRIVNLMERYNHLTRREGELSFLKCERILSFSAIQGEPTSAICVDNRIIVGAGGAITNKNIYTSDDAICYRLPNTREINQIECKNGLLCFLNDGKLFIFKDNLLTNESENSGLISNFITKIVLPEGQKIKCFDLSYGDSSKLFLASNDGKIFLHDLSIEDDLSTLGRLEGEKIYKFSKGKMFKKFEETGEKYLVSLIDGCSLVVNENGKISELCNKEGRESSETLRENTNEKIVRISNGFLLPLKNEAIFATLDIENKIKIFSFNYKENALKESFACNIKDIEDDEKILRLEVDNWNVRIYSMVGGIFVERKIAKHTAGGGKINLIE